VFDGQASPGSQFGKSGTLVYFASALTAGKSIEGRSAVFERPGGLRPPYETRSGALRHLVKDGTGKI
jgi:hypothetical protein